jgi:hypothetical protein
MYTACMFCQVPLGTNDHVEHFPIGRRLAFDPAKGRLWVVCRRCTQWNLVPLEERWEAVEECDRQYRAARARVATAEIGLARLPDGLDLIRIGEPLRPEFAAWRFGDQFGGRRRRTALRVLGGSVIAAGAGATLVAVAGSVAFAALMPGLVVGGVLAAVKGTRAPSSYSYANPLRLRADDGSVVELGRQLVLGIEMRADQGVAPFHLAMDLQRTDEYGSMRAQDITHVTVSGAEAVRAARLLLPRINSGGAGQRTVQKAVGAIAAAGSVDRFIPEALRQVRKAGLAYSPIQAYPMPIRLGIEMALHEEAERRAMEGELAELETAWREAERIAAISDELLLPSHVKAFIESHRGNGGSG